VFGKAFTNLSSISQAWLPHHKGVDNQWALVKVCLIES